MVVALLYPEPEKGGRGHKKKVGETPEFSRRRVYDARAVLAYAPEQTNSAKIYWQLVSVTS
jgi:hypothetical protein